MNVLALIACGAVVLASVPSVLGHGYIVDPAATWKDGYAVNGWGSSIDNNMWGAIDTSVYGYGTDATVAFWKAMYDASGYTSLGQYIDTNQVMYSSEIDEQCGYTVYDDTARETMPATNLTYTGFTHPGPCEVWCDDTVVLFDYNCQDTYPDIPAGISYDESLCADANRFTIYWLGVHGAPWQVFTDCVWLENGSGSGSAPSPVTEAVSADVVTAPPTTGSGSTLTATTAYPDDSSSATATTTTTTSSASTAAEASTSTEKTTTAPATTTATATSTAASADSTTTTTTTAAPATTTAATTTASTDASADSTTTAATTTTAPTTTTATTTTAPATTTATTTTAPATTTAAPTATSSDASATSTTTTTTDSTTTAEKCTRRMRRD